MPDEVGTVCRGGILKQSAAISAASEATALNPKGDKSAREKPPYGFQSKEDGTIAMASRP